MKRFALLAVALAVEFLSLGCAHQAAPQAGASGGEGGVRLTGVVDHTDYADGAGANGYIRCVFLPTSHRPVTKWGKDGATPSVRVGPYPGGTYTRATRTGHTIKFSVAAPNTAPAPYYVDLQAHERATVWIRY
jgi:hypothetical protein